MRSDARREEKKNRRDRFSRFTRRWAIIFLILTAVFCAVIAVSRMLSWKILALGGGALLLVLLLIMPPMMIRRFKQSRRIISFAVSLIMLAVYGMGTYYLTGALDLIGDITSLTEVESYYVVVRDDDEFDKLKDIAGEQVMAFRSGSGFSEAEAKLSESVDCTVIDSESLNSMVDGLLTGEYNVLLMNSANYITVSDTRKEEFSDYTKVLDVIRVHITKENFAKNVKVTSQPFNIMITGLDVDGNITNESRSDVNIVATVNPTTKQVLLTSIPRDYYVQLPGFGRDSYDKLTHTGLYGADETVAAVEALLGIDINYYIKVNYSTVVLLVDAIGGVDVFSDYEFTTNGQDWYYFDYGDNHLNGQEALAFARERQAFEDGDFQRNKNQQKVLAAIIKKMTSSPALLMNYGEILNAVKINIEMNMSSDDIKALVRMQTEDMASWNIQSQSIIGDLDLLPCYSLDGDSASVVRANVNSIEDAKVQIFAVMGKSYEPDYDNWNYYSSEIQAQFDMPESTDGYYDPTGEDYGGDSSEGSDGEYYDGSGDGSGDGWTDDSGDGSGDSGGWTDGSGDSGDSSGEGWADDLGDDSGDGSDYSGDENGAPEGSPAKPLYDMILPGSVAVFRRAAA